MTKYRILHFDDNIPWVQHSGNSQTPAHRCHIDGRWGRLDPLWDRIRGRGIPAWIHGMDRWDCVKAAGSERVDRVGCPAAR